MSMLVGRLCVSLRAVAAGQRAAAAVCRGRIWPAPPIALSPRWHMIRSLSTCPGTTVNYEELKTLMKDEGVVLIDVREPWEIKEYGIIKGSVNIPLADVASALQMTPKEFEEKYHRKLGGKSSTVVFSCLVGIRSGKALEVATSLGYDKVHHYKGGFDDWTKHEAPDKPQ
ncbi:thiosulfate sulfurtransferase/rhodanese-like domain-containing protein 3 [Hyperolius riggenbachi]|uniref:thiosulfate sulfurtransferase/rhodanese-like domain-containing protein 3 n=1 Tax=Hyperolius riggenbachi TaxID=752182 RepID=UPI0035A385E4